MGPTINATTRSGCLILMLVTGSTAAQVNAAEGGMPLVLDGAQMDAVSAGASLAIGATAHAVGRTLSAVAIADSQSSLSSLRTAFSQTEVAAGAAVAVGVGDVSRSAETGAAASVGNPLVTQILTIPVAAGPVSISITTVTAIGMDVLGVFRK